MIEVRVGMENADHREPEIPDFAQNTFMRATGVHDYGLLGHGITQNRTIASERRNRKCLPNHAAVSIILGLMLAPCPTLRNISPIETSFRLRSRGPHDFGVDDLPTLAPNFQPQEKSRPASVGPIVGHIDQRLIQV